METDFRLGKWLVRPRLNRLEARGERRTLQPRAMEVLVYLAARPRQVVSRERLLSDVWGGRFIGAQALTNAIFELRRALDDSPRRPRYIETVTKRGYRLVAPVTAASTSAAPVDPAAAPARLRKVGVAPWRDLSERGDRERFCAAMTELLTTMLAQVEALEVILLGESPAARPGGAEGEAGAGEPLAAGGSPAESAHRLDAVVECAALADAERVRLTARLVGGRGEHLWAAAYDRDLRDLLRLQAEVVRRIVDEIGERLGLPKPKDAP